MSSVGIPRACVIGHPIAHSRSPLIHGHWLETLGIAGAYEKRDVSPEAFPEFLAHLRAQGYIGANVTVPHKQTAHRIVDRRDPAAEAIGAVNTVWYEGDVLCGGNSDAHGFIASLDESAPGWDVANAHAVVLGAGGAAHAAAFALATRGVRVAVVNRTEERAREMAAQMRHGITAHSMAELPHLLASADLLANCTSLGMVGEPPLVIDLDSLSERRSSATSSTFPWKPGCWSPRPRAATASSTASGCCCSRPATDSANGSARCLAFRPNSVR
jgi:shikimate dehydrogenase